MARARLDIAYGIVENLPTILFIGLWKAGGGLEAAGWSACVSAVLILLLFQRLGRRSDTILLGINISFVIITPVIVAMFSAGQADMARFLVDYAETGAVATVLLTGAVLTAVAPGGFVGTDAGSLEARRRCSLLLLALAAGAVAWSAAHAGEHWMSIVLPMVVLFTARRFMLAHIADQSGRDESPTLAAAVLPTGE